MPAGVDCNDVAQLSAKSLGKIVKAEEKLAILADVKRTALSISPAALGYVACSAPCDAIDILGFSGTNSVSSLPRLSGAERRGGRRGERLRHLPDPPIFDPSSFTLACQRGIGKELVRQELARMKEQQKCQYAKDKGKPPTTGATDCKSADLKGKVAKTEAQGSGCADRRLHEPDVSDPAHELRARPWPTRAPA